MNVETPRLLLRKPTRADVPALFAFLGDPDAMRYTHHDGSFRECRRRVLVHEWFRRRDGYAPWTILARDDGRIIGWGGLYKDPFDPGWGVEVYYFRHCLDIRFWKASRKSTYRWSFPTAFPTRAFHKLPF